MSKEVIKGSILRKLESEIIEISHNNIDNSDENKVDIFHPLFEGRSEGSYGEGILPHLFRIMANFSEQSRKELINIFLNSSLDNIKQCSNRCLELEKSNLLSNAS